MAAHCEDSEQVVVGIETDNGLWVQALHAVGYRVYGINPLSASRYRDRHCVSGAKSDAGDAKILADLVRTDRHNHRQLADDSSAVHAIKVLARTHQSLVWARTRHSNALRAGLSQYYPAALAAFPDIDGRDALAVLQRAPDPSAGATLSLSKISSALKVAGRQRSIDARAREIQTALRSPQLHTSDQVVAALSASTTATVAVLLVLNTQISELQTQLTDHFETHPDADIYLSLPGLGVILGARVLGEFGDDPNRYTDAKSRKNYAATSQITVASGRRRAVIARHIKNRHLADAIDMWAYSSLRASPGARTFYDQHRAAGDTHHQALRALGNRFIGILHGCLRHHTHYNEHTAWARGIVNTCGSGCFRRPPFRRADRRLRAMLAG
ncbi:Transposase IS116/IS110/IS902 family protein [Mycolicibacterium smegmatis MC2 155]|uniref:Transposase IS116/IS110/IS902 family protein n=1 Tax=Mycolicibacterium smegmatis (strain ATCC 700084 / mc(2)155) TaxID=246196 RepID=A0QT65_MYCS2|nr:Transposase IS116/IS110/IS902 family protein [Mycolicibacterium smegmatis MC2 155]